jgi:hypothetical protein
LSRGVTILEVSIAGLILIVVILITMGLAQTGDHAVTTEISLRQAQFRCRQILSEIERELHDGRHVWSAPVTGTPGFAQALVYLTAVADSGKYATDPMTLQPLWQRTVAYVPAGDSLIRFDFGPGSWPADLTGASPRIEVKSASVVLEWVSGATLVTPPGSKSLARPAGIVRVPSLSLFQAQQDSSGLWNLSLAVSVPLGQGRSGSARVDAAIRGRN